MTKKDVFCLVFSSSWDAEFVESHFITLKEVTSISQVKWPPSVYQKDHPIL